MNFTAGQTNHSDFGTFSIVFDKKILSKKVCYFAGYSIFSDYPEQMYDYLTKIRDINFDIIFISSSILSKASLIKLKEYCSVIIEKENKGTDFGAWKVALTWTNYGNGFDAILLANDSVFGPFRSLKKDVERLSRNFDIWGYSSSLEVNYHIQSYFLHCNKKVIHSDFWVDFWKNVVPVSRKEEVVQNYEIGLSQKAKGNNFTIGAYVDAVALKKELKLPSEYLNYTISAWKELIVKYNFPFLKKELLVKELAHSSNGSWASVIATIFSSDHIFGIESFLNKYKAENLAAKSIPYENRKKDIIVLSHYFGKISQNQHLALNLASQISKSLNEPFLCYQLSNNKQNAALSNIDDHPYFTYLGAIDPALLEQYIYYWNKYNVKALIVDYETFRLFKTYFDSFYSGNILVVNQQRNEIEIDYLIRTHLIKTISFRIPDTDINKPDYGIRLKCEKEFLQTKDYLQIKDCIESLNLSIIWEGLNSELNETNQSEEEKRFAKSKSALNTDIILEYNNYNLTIVARNEIIYFTDDVNDCCYQLQQKLAHIPYDEVEVRNKLENPLFELSKISAIYELCFSKPETNISTSPSTVSFTHIFYEDTLYEMMPYLYNLNYLVRHKHFFSISEETINKEQIAKKLKSIFPDAVIQIVKNSGKDIGGKLILLKLYLELGNKADYLVLLHDKKSLHSWTIEGNQWRNELFKIAEPQYIFEVFSQFENNEELGIIGNKKWINNTDYDYSKRKFAFHDAFFKRKLREYGISITNYEFVGGTMFWMRDELLRSFFSRYSLLEILEKLEQGNILDSKEGTETHFLERFFGWYATSKKFTLSGV